MSPLLWIPGRSLAGHVTAATVADSHARRADRKVRGMTVHRITDVGIERHEIVAAGHSLEPLSRR